MSTQHSIDITIKAKLNEKNISHILQIGSKLNFVYYDYVNTLERNLFPEIINIDQALIRLLFPCYNTLEDYGRSLLVKNNDVFFHMYFLENQKNINTIKISLANFSNEWKQDFFSSGTSFYTIKYQRFIKTGLALCKDFCIQKIVTETY